MSEIHIRRVHGMSHDKARKSAEKVARKLEDEFKLAWQWNGDTVHFERTGVHGTLHVGNKEIRLNAKLGFMLGLVAPKIESEIHRHLDEIFEPRTRKA
jgi:putative polyhydroxyalkanoate system protein